MTCDLSAGQTVRPTPDLYNSFAELAAAETEGVHYQIRVIERASKIVVVAPHGGKIEPGSSETAALIAGTISRSTASKASFRDDACT
ncbi:MAG: poly-gamma-glutamate hydrolase family protein [Methylocystis sp.]